MPEIWFYDIALPLDDVLIPLLEQAYASGLRSIVYMTSQERLTYLDHKLWTYSDVSFLPHLAINAAEAHSGGMLVDQPICLTLGIENVNKAPLAIFIENATPRTVLKKTVDNLSQGQEKVAPHKRCVILFDGSESEKLDQARYDWQSLTEAGHKLTYWKQDHQGGWEKRSAAFE